MAAAMALVSEAFSEACELKLAIEKCEACERKLASENLQ